VGAPPPPGVALEVEPGSSELRRQARHLKLEETLAVGKPLESVLAQVDQLDARQLRVFDDARRRVRHEDLAAVRRVADAAR
jgi:hypothetical protein